MKDKKAYKQFINDVSALLDIKAPSVVYNDEMFTDTQLAMYNLADNEIVLKSHYESNADAFFTIAHELRHAWQSKQSTWGPLIKQAKSNINLSPNEYNEQPTEIDAHAFGTYIMTEWFGIKPLFNGFHTNLVDRIYNHAIKIKEVLNNGK